MPENRTGLLLIFLFIPGILLSQIREGKVLSAKTHSGIGYVNVGIIGRNVGTVSDESGNFRIDLENKFDNDSIRFSMIGYESRTITVNQFRRDSIKEIYLTPRSYYLQEVKVVYQKPRFIRLGTEVTAKDLKSGFQDNDLGSELGIALDVKRQVKLKNLNLNVATCTFDSVTYRLNIYKSENQSEYKNILTEPIYLSFSKDQISKVITFDLSAYSITIEGDVLITLELYKDLGPGRLLFYTTFFTGDTWHKKTSQGDWSKSPGIIGMYLTAQVIKN
jgi:hypothetical protein